MATLVAPTERRQQGANHKEEPEEKAHEQECLPEATQLQVFITLMTEVEVLDQPQLLHDAKPLSGQRTKDDDEQGDEKHIHPQALVFGFLARHSGSDIESRSEP